MTLDPTPELQRSRRGVKPTSGGHATADIITLTSDAEPLIVVPPKMCAPMLDERADAKTCAAKKFEVDLPAVDCDVLYGTAAIARWLGMTRGQVKPLIDGGIIPTFKPPGRTARCALKSAINETFHAYARRSAARNAPLDRVLVRVTGSSTKVD